MQNNKKPYLNFNQQLELLQSRGMLVSNHELALTYLQKIGYYRLSGYWYPFRNIASVDLLFSPEKRLDSFSNNTFFSDVVDLYVFDKRLRLLILDALERIEVAFRVDICNVLGKKNAFAYMNQNLLHGNFTKKSIKHNNHKTRYELWFQKYKAAINRSKEDFIKHYKDKYGEPLPIWVAAEVWDFGMLSTFFQGMKINDKALIASKYGINKAQILESWLRSLNFVRNVAAHHSRLWNRNLIDQPMLPESGLVFEDKASKTKSCSRIYVVLWMISYLLSYVNPTSSWICRLTEHLKTLPDVQQISMKDMGILSLEMRDDLLKFAE